MRLDPIDRACPDCDGCGVRASDPAPPGWFDRLLDPPYYTGPRRLLFCPRCYAALPALQQRRWRCLGRPRTTQRMVTVGRRLFHFPTLPRRGSVG
jgi:hypothetical protein